MSNNFDNLDAPQAYDLVDRVSLQQAFSYAFSEEASHETAQANFTQAHGSHYSSNASYTRDSFIALLRHELDSHPGYCTSAFCQIFLNITAYVHQFVDTGLDRYIALEFAKYHSQPSALKQARAPGKDMQPVKFSNGLHTTYLSYLEATDRDGLKPTHSMPCLEKLYISLRNIQSLADIDSRRLKMACLCSYDQVNTTKLIRYCTRLRGGISSEVRHTESSDSMKMQVMDVLKRQICGGWSVGSELDSSDDGRSFTTAQESYAFDDTF